MRWIKNLCYITLLCFSFIVKARQTKFYVNLVDGDDTNPGTIERPWETLKPLNKRSFEAGDSINFARGSNFEGGLLISNSGTVEAPIVLTAYGKGETPAFKN